MPDLKMTLAFEAERTIAPLAAYVRKLTKQLDTLRQREISEAENLTKAVDDVVRWKGLAGEYLADGPGGFARFQTGLKRAMAKEETARESIQIFDRELVPNAQRELDTARKKLTDAFAALAVAARGDCENRLTALLAAVVAEHDAFQDAIRELGATFGTAFHGEAPKVYSPRLDGVRHTMTGKRWLTFSKAPTVTVAPATMPPAAVLTQPKAVESTPTAAREESVKGATPLPPTIAPDHAQDGPGPLSVDAARAKVLLRSPVATGTPLDVAPGETTPLEPPQEAAPVDLDPAPLAVAAEVEAELAAEAPPVDGEKEI